MWLVILFVLLWAFLNRCPLGKSSPTTQIFESTVVLRRLENQCPSYLPLIECGTCDILRSDAEEDQILCPSLVETALALKKCPVFLPDTKTVSMTDELDALTITDGWLFKWLFSTTVVLMIVNFLRKWWPFPSSPTRTSLAATTEQSDRPVDENRAAPGGFGSPIASFLRHSASLQSPDPTSAQPATPSTPTTIHVNNSICSDSSSSLRKSHANRPLPPGLDLESGHQMDCTNVLERAIHQVSTSPTHHDHQLHLCCRVGMHDQLIDTDGDMQVFQLGDRSDSDSIPESLQTSTASSQQYTRQTRAATRRSTRRH